MNREPITQAELKAALELLRTAGMTRRTSGSAALELAKTARVALEGLLDRVAAGGVE